MEATLNKAVARQKVKIRQNLLCQKWKEPFPHLKSKFEEACKICFALFEFPEYLNGSDVSIALSDDAHIKELNSNFRGKDKPTNVLSFPYVDFAEGDFVKSDVNDKTTFGDIVLAFETIERECAEQNKVFEEHALHLVIHSALHLLGFDHEDDEMANRMETIEVAILKKFGIENPYIEKT